MVFLYGRELPYSQTDADRHHHDEQQRGSNPTTTIHELRLPERFRDEPLVLDGRRADTTPASMPSRALRTRTTRACSSGTIPSTQSSQSPSIAAATDSPTPGGSPSSAIRRCRSA